MLPLVAPRSQTTKRAKGEVTRRAGKGKQAHHLVHENPESNTHQRVHRGATEEKENPAERHFGRKRNLPPTHPPFDTYLVPSPRSRKRTCRGVSEGRERRHRRDTSRKEKEPPPQTYTHTPSPFLFGTYLKAQSTPQKATPTSTVDAPWSRHAMITHTNRMMCIK